MPKSLVLGNGNILITLDRYAQVRDFYFPFVGLENQAGSLFIHKIGVWVDNQISWLDNGEWDIKINYQKETLISEIIANNPRLEIKIEFNDVVYNEKNIFIREATIENSASRERDIKIFFHQQFEMYESHRGDTAYYDPQRNAIIHYKGRRMFLINLMSDEKGMDDFCVGLFSIEGKEGTFKDAEDGVLSKNTVEHGLVDSTVGLNTHFKAGERVPIYYWIVAGQLEGEIDELNRYVLEKSPSYLMRTTKDFWFAWVNRHSFKFHGLDKEIGDVFKKSILVMRTHVDNGGAILASGDTDILHMGRDAYSYMWPRDGAFSSMALAKVGETNLSKRFFEFCNEVVSSDGYFMQRYRADKSLGSSWHPFMSSGSAQLPIQEDETALIIIALWNHYNYTKDLDFIEEIYNSLIRKCAEFMVSHRDPKTGLPIPSYDLWEEKFGIHTFTVSAVYAALNAAARFANLLGKTEKELGYTKAAKEIQQAILKHLYDENEGYFYKSIFLKDGEIDIDRRIDASAAFGVFKFEVLPPSDQRLKKAIDKTKEKLTVHKPVGGIARFEGDPYFRVFDDSVGNPWFITTLWLAQFYAKVATNEAELSLVKDTLGWAVKYALSSGILSEQLNPESGEHISASPLIWSHAEFVITVLDYLEKLDELGICMDCDPISLHARL